MTSVEVQSWSIIHQPEGDAHWHNGPRLSLALPGVSGEGNAKLEHLEWRGEDGSESSFDYQKWHLAGRRQDAQGRPQALHGTSTETRTVSGLLDGDFDWEPNTRVFAVELPGHGAREWLLDDGVSPTVQLAWRDEAGNSAALEADPAGGTVTGWYRPAGGAEMPLRGTVLSAPTPVLAAEVPAGPGTLEEWVSLLRARSEEYLSSETEDAKEYSELAQVQRDERWLGFEPATEAQVEAVEQRLQVTLPPSYRTFLLASNGFCELGRDVSEVRPVQDVGWFREVERDLVEAWRDADLDDVMAVLDRCLAIGQGDLPTYWMMDPTQVDAAGEYLVYRWYPGDGEDPEPIGTFAETVARASLT